MMSTPNSNHEDIVEGGFSGVKGGACDYIVQSPNQSLQLVPHPIGFNSFDSVDSYSVRISSEIDDGQVGVRTSSSNPKASKKKNGYHHRQGVKKQRLIWTQELHQLFLEIHNRSPNGKVFPKKILEQMREKFPFVTRENVASHLQKHRLFLKKMNNKENSAKSSSKSAPPKVSKESISQTIHNNTSNSNSNSTNPNSQIIPQSHSNSTNPNSQLHLPRHPNSTNPNSHLHQPKKPHIEHETWLNHEVHFHFDQTNNVSNQTILMQQQQPSFNNNNVRGGTNIYSNMINVCEIQENPNLALPLGQSSIATTTDLAFSVNLYPPPISVNQISNFDGNNNGNGNVSGIGFMDDSILGTLPNLGFGDYNMNLNVENVQVDDHVLNNDHMYCLGSYSEGNLDFGYPFNFNAINDFQMHYEQAHQSIFCPSVNHMENDSTLQQCFGSYHHHLLPQTFENQWVEQQSNFTRMNEYFPSKGQT